MERYIWNPLRSIQRVGTDIQGRMPGGAGLPITTSATPLPHDFAWYRHSYGHAEGEVLCPCGEEMTSHLVHSDLSPSPSTATCCVSDLPKKTLRDDHKRPSPAPS